MDEHIDVYSSEVYNKAKENFDRSANGAGWRITFLCL
jgi:hypothetical protein